MSTRKCAHCAKPLPSDADYRKLYCDTKCKDASHNLNMARGKEAVAYLQVWRAGKNAKTEEDKALARYAFKELCALADSYNKADRVTGREPSKLLAPRLDRGEVSADRKLGARAKPDQMNGQRKAFAPAD